MWDLREGGWGVESSFQRKAGWTPQLQQAQPQHLPSTQSIIERDCQKNIPERLGKGQL